MNELLQRIEIRVAPGTHIKDALWEALNVARAANYPVRLRFMRREMEIQPWDTADEWSKHFLKRHAREHLRHSLDPPLECDFASLCLWR